MSNIKAKAVFHKNNVKLNIVLSLFQFIEDDVYFLYSPALEITGYGKTEDEAHESFKISLEMFLDYTSKKKTLKAELKKLGWKIDKKPKLKATPP